MVNNLQNESFASTCFEIILYSDQEAEKWREGPNKVIAAEPLSWWKPKEVVEENASTRKRKRCTFTELEVEKEKEFSLLELYKSNNINEIILNIEKGETTLDPQELLKNLKGWTVEKRKRQEKNGNGKVDKIYRHPKSKRILRSLVEVKKFIEENSYFRKASNNGESGSQGAQSNMYLQLFQRLEETLCSSAQQTCNNSSKIGSSSSSQCAPKTTRCTTFKSHHDTMELSLQSHRPLHHQVSYPSPQSEQSDSSKQQVVTNLTRTDIGPSHCDVFGASSSSINVSCLDQIKTMVESQIEARVAQVVAEKVSQYERSQREMVERMASMHRLLVLGGLLPPSDQ